MPENTTKKLLIIYILDILKTESSFDNRLKQNDFINLLKKKYNMNADRKSIKRNLLDLIETGFPISYTTTSRINKNGEKETVYTDWYIEREFDDSELRLIIDSLLFSKHIPANHCKALIEKLERLSTSHFKAKVKHVCNVPYDIPRNSEFFLTVEILDEAIEKGKKVCFEYADYNTDKRLEPRKSGDTNRKYIVNPYQMVATNGHYYLISNIDKYDDVSHFRVDKIINISLLDQAVKPKTKVKGLEGGLNLPRHMAEHIYMFSGQSATVTMVAPRKMVGDIVDWFGNGVKFSDITEQSVTARVYVNLQAMHYWALQYAPFIRITSPKSLVDTVKKDLKTALFLYEQNQ